MDTHDKSKSFAFKLAKDAQKQQKPSSWQVRDGVAVAGCTGPQARADIDIWGQPRGLDNGYWC